jgi:hypothetical protein
MKNITFAGIRFLTFSAAVVCSLPLHAAEPIEVHWNRVCNVARDHSLTIKTVKGETVEGYCVSINADEIAITTKDRRIVKIARAALSRIQMQRPKNHNLSSLRGGMHEGLRQGFGLLFSPYAPLGIVVVPGTLAWGAVAAPFCLLGDLKDRVTREQEIKVN